VGGQIETGEQRGPAAAHGFKQTKPWGQLDVSAGLQGWRLAQFTPGMQYDGPSLDGKLQPADNGQSVQFAAPVHERAQVPLGRQSCPPGQGQVMVWLQLLIRGPHPGAQVVACGSGLHPGAGGGPGGDPGGGGGPGGGDPGGPGGGPSGVPSGGREVCVPGSSVSLALERLAFLRHCWRFFLLSIFLHCLSDLPAASSVFARLKRTREAPSSPPRAWRRELAATSDLATLSKWDPFTGASFVRDIDDLRYTTIPHWALESPLGCPCPLALGRARVWTGLSAGIDAPGGSLGELAQPGVGLVAAHFSGRTLTVEAL
jgi:hypothetical protein